LIETILKLRKYLVLNEQHSIWFN